MLRLEERSNDHLLDLGEGGKLAEDHHAQELTFMNPALAKLEKAGAIDWLQGRKSGGTQSLAWIVY